MTLFVVRHASAGDRSTWIGDDSLRPLDERGVAQSLAVCDLIAPLGCTTLVSSPALRCVQTLAPLSERTGLDVVTDDRLAEDSPFEPALGLLEDCPDGTVTCSHGDLIPDLIGAMLRRGMVLDGAVVRRHGFVGAGAVVPPGKVVESGELWLGNPAKPVRRLSDREIEQLYYSAKHYVRLKDAYLGLPAG